MRNLYLLILFITSLNSWGQIGIVADSDGYLNVRRKPSGKIVDTLQKGDLFFISVDSEDSTWIAIEYGEGLKTGFVHHNGIIEITKLEIPVENIPKLIFKTKPVQNSENRKFYGGMNLPISETYELDEICLVHESDTIQQDSKFSRNVLTPFLPAGNYNSIDLMFNGKLKVYCYEDLIYYRMKLGDGSEYYESVWILKNDKIIQRLIGWIV